MEPSQRSGRKKKGIVAANVELSESKLPAQNT